MRRARSLAKRESPPRKKAFAVGTQAYADGEFEAALTSFRRAYDLTGSPDLLYNIATVSDRMRRDEEALEAYEGYLEARPKSADREHVESRIDVLRAAIEARRRAELDAEIEARSAAIEAAARVKAERPLTQYVGPGPGPWITIGVGGAAVVSGAVLVGLGQRDQKSVESAVPGLELFDGARDGRPWSAAHQSRHRADGRRRSRRHRWRHLAAHRWSR